MVIGHDIFVVMQRARDLGDFRVEPDLPVFPQRAAVEIDKPVVHAGRNIIGGPHHAALKPEPVAGLPDVEIIDIIGDLGVFFIC